MRRSSRRWTPPGPPRRSRAPPWSRYWSWPPTDPHTIRRQEGVRRPGAPPPVPDRHSLLCEGEDPPMSDHFSGPRALAGPAGDICDVYAFPSPERPDHLVLAMTVLPLAGPDAFFSDAIICRFRLRPLTIEADRPAFAYGPEESELVFSCTFGAPRPGADSATVVQDGVCTSPFGETARFRAHDERGGREGGLRAYAGLRSDPFF